MIALEVMLKYKEGLSALTKNDILQPYLSPHGFRSPNVNDVGEVKKDIEKKLHDFDIRYQTDCTVAQPLEVEIKFEVRCSCYYKWLCFSFKKK